VSNLPGSKGLEHLAQGVAERVVTLVLEAIDIDALVERIDVEKLVERVDVERIIDQVDVQKIIDRVDIQAIIDRVDISGIVNRVDIDALMEQTELGTIIARSTTGVFSQVLDLVRAQGVGLDDFFARWTNKILRRDPASLPSGPALLVPSGTVAMAPSLPGGDRG
jgi:hypothetical protein